MVDVARQLLDELMGRNRNQDPQRQTGALKFIWQTMTVLNVFFCIVLLNCFCFLRNTLVR